MDRDIDAVLEIFKDFGREIGESAQKELAESAESLKASGIAAAQDAGDRIKAYLGSFLAGDLTRAEFAVAVESEMRLLRMAGKLLAAQEQAKFEDWAVKIAGAGLKVALMALV